MRIEASSKGIELRAAQAEDMPACATILNTWIDATHWMPRVHSHEDVVSHHCDFVYANRRVLIAVGADNAVKGFLATSDERFVTGFYLAAASRGSGLGSRMISHVKLENPDGLSLWTFVANTGAQNFYRKHGFQEIKRTNGENEEKLPDILFEWKPGEAA